MTTIDKTDITVSAFYHFTPFDDPAGMKDTLQDQLVAAGVMGTVLLAPEGVNGTIAGTAAGINQAMAIIRALPGCTPLENKLSHADEMPFYRMKVRLKKEIVTMGIPGVDPSNLVGTYVDPKDWNALIEDPDTVVIDTRNDYEVSIGTFDKAINPETAAFRDFPTWFKENRENLEGKKVAMFCTGGIRCEKSTSYLKQEGMPEVYHLKGGILKYLETVPAEENRFDGECFVFDQRVSVKHGLELGTYDMCHACRYPITADDKLSPAYVPGVSCPYCIDKNTDAQRERFAERQRQIQLAKSRGEKHIGTESVSATREINSAEGFEADPMDAMLPDFGVRGEALDPETLLGLEDQD